MAAPSYHIPQTSGIYQIRCLVNSKVYIGSAVNLAQRWSLHRSRLVRGIHHSLYLQSSWLKYGKDQFIFEVLELVTEKTDLTRIEQEWLDKIQPFDRAKGFNNNPTAGSMLGFKFTDESKAKMSRKTMSPESRAKTSAALKGRKKSPEHIAKVRASRGIYVVTAEARAKMSAAHKGKKQSPESIAKRAAINKGRKMAPEVRAHLSKVRMGMLHTPETKAKLVEAWKRRKARKKQQPMLSFMDD